MKSIQLNKIYTVSRNVPFRGEYPKEELLDFFKSYAYYASRHIVGTHSIKFFIENCLGYYVSSKMICDVLLSLGYSPVKKVPDYLDWKWHMKFHNIYRLDDSEDFSEKMIVLDSHNHVVFPNV